MKPARVIQVSNAQILAWLAGMLFVAGLAGWFVGTLLGRAAL
jgi:hypothetical protein